MEKKQDETHFKREKPCANKLKIKKIFLKMFRNLFRRESSATLFMGHFVDVKAMYYLRFERIPCVCFVAELDVSKAFTHFEAVMRNEIVEIYQHSFLDHAKAEMFFNNTVFVLRQRR